MGQDRAQGPYRDSKGISQWGCEEVEFSSGKGPFSPDQASTGSLPVLKVGTPSGDPVLGGGWWPPMRSFPVLKI